MHCANPCGISNDCNYYYVVVIFKRVLYTMKCFANKGNCEMNVLHHSLAAIIYLTFFVNVDYILAKYRKDSKFYGNRTFRFRNSTFGE